MLPLHPEEIHLWFVFCDRITDASLLERYRQMLSGEERQQERRFQLPRSRHRYLLTRALVRTCLSRYAPLRPEEWVFGSGRHGRPLILNKGSAVADLSFNISHTEDVVLLGVTARRALGVDIEHLRSRTPSMQLADRYFSSAEADALRSLQPLEQQARFFDYWTLKESYIKARSLGLSIPLDQFGFRIAGGALALQVEPELGDRADGWLFWLLRPCAGHVAAVCAERAGGAPSLLTRTVVPLESEELLECEVLARSP